MLTIFIVIQFILAIFLTIAVMLQKSSSIGLGVYSGSNESVFGARGPAGFLAKATFTLGVLFIANTVALTYTFNENRTKSVTDVLPTTKVPQAPRNTVVPITPIAPIVPAEQKK